MTFEGQYLTYLEYKDIVESIGGSPMEEMPFNLLEFESRRQIDIRTQNRLKDIDSTDIPQEVKLCEYKLINSMCNYDERLESIKGNVVSESTDGYSVSYITGNQITDILNSKAKEQDDIIREYLLNVIVDGQHIMYLGVE